jgi:PKD repeat protein
MMPTIHAREVTRFRILCEGGVSRGESVEQPFDLRYSDRKIEREEQNLKKKIVAAAILMCAVMVLVAGAPLVMADTHHIVKGAQGPRASAVSWLYVPQNNGFWHGHIVNAGLRSLMVDVVDVASGGSMLHQRIRFATYPSDTVDTQNATMTMGRTYNITATPNGPRTTYCDVEDVFAAILPPVALFTPTVSGTTVSVDGSASYDPNVGGTITGWGWDFGDGTTGTGVTASHTYSASKVYTIILVVLSSTGLTGSTSHDVSISIVDTPPVAAFTWTVTGYTVNVNGGTSTDDHGIASYSWNWGDGSPAGSGVTASHTYTAVPPLVQTITLTVTDNALPVGQTNSVSHAVTLQDNPPVAAFTSAVSGFTVNVDGSTSTDDHGIASYSWNWGDGSPADAGVLATHTYAQSGTYTIALTVTDTVGQTNSASHQVIVSGVPPPVASFIITSAANADPVTVDATASTGTGTLSYLWNWGDNVTSAGVTSSHYYLPPSKDWTITLTVTDSLGQKASMSLVNHVTNNNLPPLPYTIYGFTFASDGATGLAGCTVTITDVRTGMTLVSIVPSDDTGFYSADIMPLMGGLSAIAGDNLIVTAVGPAGQHGSGTGVLDTSAPYMEIDVTLV